MSRELKFRAWVYYGEKLDKPNYSRDYGSLDRFFEDHSENDCDQCIEQYTGLKDKNGKEIYEGDIVEQFVCGVKEFKGKKCGRRTVWQVRWNEEECCFELHYLGGSLFGDSLMAKGEEYEVIGNIHEPPKDFRPEHLKRMGVTMVKGGKE